MAVDPQVKVIETQTIMRGINALKEYYVLKMIFCKTQVAVFYSYGRMK